MPGALLTALFFGITPVCANRAIRILGVVRANLWRLVVAASILGLWTLLFGRSLHSQAMWFIVAGAVGFGLGGMCMFLALPRLGAPLAALLVESIAAVNAAVMAWAWYQDAIPFQGLISAFIVLTGVGLGLLPYILSTEKRHNVLSGTAWIVLAGLGQAVSITISRKALLSLKLAGEIPNLPTAAFMRLLGGMAIALLLWLLLKGTDGSEEASTHGSPQRSGQAWLWVGLNALFGPILGVTCLIWALQTMQPGLVQTIAATAPLVSVPFARWLEGHTPPPLYYLGCVVALAGLSGIYFSG